MKTLNLVRIALVVLMLSLGTFVALGQPQLLKRTTFKTDKVDFGAGGTIEIKGSPVGSIRVEGGSLREYSPDKRFQSLFEGSSRRI